MRKPGNVVEYIALVLLITAQVTSIWKEVWFR